MLDATVGGLGLGLDHVLVLQNARNDVGGGKRVDHLVEGRWRVHVVVVVVVAGGGGAEIAVVVVVGNVVGVVILQL